MGEKLELVSLKVLKEPINVETLCKKLSSFGFVPSSLKLIQSCLSQRWSYVTCNDYVFNDFIIFSGLPQESNLGPLLVILYVNDLVEIDCPIFGDADDIKNLSLLLLLSLLLFHS